MKFMGSKRIYSGKYKYIFWFKVGPKTHFTRAQSIKQAVVFLKFRGVTV